MYVYTVYNLLLANSIQYSMYHFDCLGNIEVEVSGASPRNKICQLAVAVMATESETVDIRVRNGDCLERDLYLRRANVALKVDVFTVAEALSWLRLSAR